MISIHVTSKLVLSMTTAPVRLPDRLTDVHIKGDDHPVPFAQGVPDGTQHGMYFSSTTAATRSSDRADVKKTGGWVSHGPAWGPEELADNMGCPKHFHESNVIDDEVFDSRRHFRARDKELKFEPREEFAGKREGFVFRLGLMGVGYYEDRPLTEVEIGMEHEYCNI